MTEVRFLRMPDVREKVGLSRSQIYRLIQEGTFPAPVKIGAQVSVWPDNEIHRWQMDALQKAGRCVAALVDSTIG